MSETHWRDNSTATLPPSRYRLNRALQTGSLPRSRYLAAAAACFVTLALTASYSTAWLDMFGTWIARQLSAAPLQLTAADAISFGPVTRLALWCFALLCVGPACWLLVTLAQTRFRVTFGSVSATWRPSEARAVPRPIAACAAAVQWAGLLIVTFAIAFQLSGRHNLAGLAPDSLADQFFAVLLRVSIIILALGLADYALRWAVWYKRMRMTRAEWLAELKEHEGDPAVRTQLRQRHRQVLFAGREHVEQIDACHQCEPIETRKESSNPT